ncbi:MAG: response regulator transcription factor [Bacteroidota bacterium]
MKIALVDDHKLFRKGMKALLEEIEGIEVIFEAANGQELLDHMAEQQAEIILLDLEMPVMDGVTVLPKIQSGYPDTKVLILSMHQDDQFIVHLLEQGAHGYLLKDTELEELEDALESVKENGFYFNDRTSRAMLSRLTRRQKIKPTFGHVEPLSERETEVLKLICEEFTTSEIADKLFLSPRTIEGYRNRLLEKTGAKNTAGLVVFAARQGYLDKM